MTQVPAETAYDTCLQLQNNAYAFGSNKTNLNLIDKENAHVAVGCVSSGATSALAVQSNNMMSATAVLTVTTNKKMKPLK